MFQCQQSGNAPLTFTIQDGSFIYSKMNNKYDKPASQQECHAIENSHRLKQLLLAVSRQSGQLMLTATLQSARKWSADWRVDDLCASVKNVMT